MLDDLMEDLNRPTESSLSEVDQYGWWKEVSEPNLKVEPKRWSWLEQVAHSQVITGEPKV